MAKGKFGTTMAVTAASAVETTAKAAKSPSMQWAAIITAAVLALADSLLGRYKSDDFEHKARASEAASANAVEANAVAIKALADALVVIHKKEEKHGDEINKSIIQMQTAIRTIDDQTRDLVVRVTVAEKVRAAHRAARDRRRMHASSTHRPRREETDSYAIPGTRDTLAGDKPTTQPAPKPVKLTAPEKTKSGAVTAAVKNVQEKSHSRLVPRVWGNDGTPGEKK